MITKEAADSIVFDIHRRAFLGRMRQHGEVPANDKEAAALVDLGFELQARLPLEQGQPQNYGEGPYAQIKSAFDQHFRREETAPGFEKISNAVDVALRRLPDRLVEQAYEAAYQLSCDPAVYEAASIKMAELEAWVASQQQSQQQSVT